MPEFRLDAPFQPTGDQPEAIRRLSDGPREGLQAADPAGGHRHRQDLDASSNVIQNAGKPTLVLAHNKTLAAQLYSEFRDFFPDNAVEYFVSYFDYYQPEAYLPRSDTYIEKDSSRNDEIDKLRHAATRALFERKDVIIVASVSCIYGLGAPVDYGATVRPDAHRRPISAGRHPAPAGRPPVPAQRPGAVARQVPGPRRHARAPARLRRLHRPCPVLRRRGGAHHGARPGHRRAARGAQRAERLPGLPLRDAPGEAQGSHRRHRGGGRCSASRSWKPRA